MRVVALRGGFELPPGDVPTPKLLGSCIGGGERGSRHQRFGRCGLRYLVASEQGAAFLLLAANTALLRLTTENHGD